MSRFKIKLRLPEQDSSSSITTSSPAQTMEAASTQDKAASTPTPLTSQNMRENDAGESSRGQGDASMAAASSMADESEDELASGDDNDDDDLSRGGTPSSSTAAAANLAAGGDDRNSPAMRLIARQKRSARLAELEQMTAEEIDALPPAKRRVGAKARGASGPGRGWRKGLKMGDKPKYTLPDTTPIAEGTPNSFDDSRRDSPFSAMSGSPEPSTLGRPGSQPSSSRAPQPAAAVAPLAFAAPGQRAKKGELSHTAQAALAGKSILPSGRAPVAVAAAMAFGPPVKPPVKIVNVFPPAYPASSRDVGKKCRKWVKGERQWVNLAGRVVKIGTWWGGEDEGYDPAKDEVEASTLAPASAMSPSASRQATPSITTGPPIEPIPKKEAATAAAAASTSSKSKGSGSKSGKGSRKSGAASSPFISAASPSSSAGATKPSSPSQLPKPKFQPGGGGADWKSGGGAGSPTPGAGVSASARK